MADSTERDHSYIYVDDVNEHLICPICRQPFIEPDQTHCGHIFCRSCIAQALQSSSLCPIDRLPLSSDDIKPAPKIVASLVNELVVRCPRECGVDVERGCLKGHLKGACDLETMACPCGELITRRDQRRVMESEQIEDGNETEMGCVHEWQRCNDCTATFRRLNRSDHIQACPTQQSLCQHCSTLLPNSTLQSHNEACPSFPIACPNTPLGCPSATIPRSSLPEHLQKCPFTPLSPLLHSLLTRLSTLENQPPPPPDPEIDRLRADLNILNQALGDLEIRSFNAVVNERIRMGEEVERLRGQVGALRREVWFTRRRDFGGMEMGSAGGAGAVNTTGLSPAEFVPTKRLSDSTTKQIVKL